MSELTQRVIKVVADSLDVALEKITPESRFIEDLGADSLDTVELVMAFEEEFGAEIDDDTAANFQTVKDVVDHLAETVSA